MNNQLSTEVNTNHFIIYHDGSVEEVNGKVAEMLFKGSRDGFIRFGNPAKTINLKSISKLLPIAEYYKQYPDRRPDVYPDREEFPPMKPWTRDRYIKTLEAMIEAFKKSCGSGVASKTILAKMENSLNKAKHNGEFPENFTPAHFMS